MIFDLTKRKGGSPAPQNPTAGNSDVIFIDYDGTIRYSYTKAEFAQLSELPPNPDHTDMGLVAEGWNWSLANAKSYVSKYRFLVIGQTYHTASGATEIDIELQPGRTEPTIALYIHDTNSQQTNGIVEVDWGDNSTPAQLEGAGWGGSQATASHAYATFGNYTIKITPKTSSTTYGFVGASGKGSYLLCKSTASSKEANHCYHNAVKAIRLGNQPISNSLKYFYAYCFSYLNAAYITIPKTMNALAGSGSEFLSGSSVTTVIIGQGTTNTALSVQDNSYVRWVSYPDTATFTSGDYTWRGVPKLRRLSIPESITKIGNFNAHGLTCLYVPENVTSYGSNALGLKELHFTSTTPPTITMNLSSSSNLPDDCIVYVPYSADHSVLTDYQSVTNLASLGERLQEEPQ